MDLHLPYKTQRTLCQRRADETTQPALGVKKQGSQSQVREDR